MSVITAIIALTDTDKDKRIQKKEFGRFAKCINGNDKPAHMLFKAADFNNDNTVSPKELKKLNEKLHWTLKTDKPMDQEEFTKAVKGWL